MYFLDTKQQLSKPAVYPQLTVILGCLSCHELPYFLFSISDPLPDSNLTAVTPEPDLKSGSGSRLASQNGSQKKEKVHKFHV
jgi:hypothetical protein